MAARHPALLESDDIKDPIHAIVFGTALFLYFLCGSFVFLYEKSELLFITYVLKSFRRGFMPSGYYYFVSRVWDYLYVHSKLGTMWDVTQLVLSLCSCVLYVVVSYGTEHWAFYGFEVFSCVFFALDWFYQFLFSQSKTSYYFSFFSFIDFITVVPVFLYLLALHPFSGLVFLRFIRLLRAQNLTIFDGNDVVKHVFHFGVVIVALLFCSAAIVQLLERIGDPFDGFEGGQSVTFFDALYFVIITMSTVGYGDILPTVWTSKIAVVLMIAFAVVIIPAQSSSLLEVFGRQSKYKKAYTGKGTHVIVCGDITVVGVEDLFREFYHEGHLDHQVSLVILHPSDPSPRLVELMLHPKFLKKVQYVAGSVLSPSDMEKAGGARASGIFIISDRLSADPQQSDEATILRTYAVKQYRPDLPCYVQMLLSRNEVNVGAVITHKDHTTSIFEMKLSLMAFNCIIPGFSTLLINMVASRSYHGAKKPKFNSDSHDWSDEYAYGAGLEVYRVPVPPIFEKKRMRDVVKRAYIVSNITIFGVEMSITDSYVHLSIGALDYVLNHGDNFVVLAQTKASAYSAIRKTATYEAKLQGRLKSAKVSPFRVSNSVLCADEDRIMYPLSEVNDPFLNMSTGPAVKGTDPTGEPEIAANPDGDSNAEASEETPGSKSGLHRGWSAQSGLSMEFYDDPALHRTASGHSLVSTNDSSGMGRPDRPKPLRQMLADQNYHGMQSSHVNFDVGARERDQSEFREGGGDGPSVTFPEVPVSMELSAEGSTQQEDVHEVGSQGDLFGDPSGEAGAASPDRDTGLRGSRRASTGSVGDVEMAAIAEEREPHESGLNVVPSRELIRSEEPRSRSSGGGDDNDSVGGLGPPQRKAHRRSNSDLQAQGPTFRAVRPLRSDSGALVTNPPYAQLSVQPPAPPSEMGESVLSLDIGSTNHKFWEQVKEMLMNPAGLSDQEKMWVMNVVMMQLNGTDPTTQPEVMGAPPAHIMPALSVRSHISSDESAMGMQPPTTLNSMAHPDGRRRMSVVKQGDDFFTRQAKRRDHTAGVGASPRPGITGASHPRLSSRARKSSSARPNWGRKSSSIRDLQGAGGEDKGRRVGRRRMSRHASLERLYSADSYKLVRLRMRSEYTSVNHPMYRYLARPRSLREAILRELPGDFVNHILVCRMIPSIEGFIMPLRLKALAKVRKIVILTSEPPDLATWERMAYFEDIYIVLGDCNSFRDLARAGVEGAGAVVVWDDRGEKRDWRFMDTLTLLTLRTVAMRCPSVPVLGKLVHSENIRLVDGKNIGERFDDIDPHELPSFASGQIFPDSMIGTFLYQAYYNDIGISVANIFLESGSEHHLKREFRKLIPRQGRLFHIPVPESFVGQPYYNLYKYVLEELKGVPLGLYRSKLREVERESFETSLEEDQREDADSCSAYLDKYYVFTAPPPTTTVYVGDFVYFVAQSVPEKLRESFCEWEDSTATPVPSNVNA